MRRITALTKPDLRSELRSKTSAGGFGLLLFCATSAGAHDFWIEPEQWQTSPGQTLALQLKVGVAFQGRSYRRNPPHIRDFFITGRSGRHEVTEKPGADPAGRVVMPAAGTLVAGYRSNSTRIELPAEKFTTYLQEESFDSVIAARQQAGQTDQPGTEAFSRYAKAILNNARLDQGYRQNLGFELEMIPQKNPYAMSTGDHLPLIVYFNGKAAESFGTRLICLPGLLPGRDHGVEAFFL